MNKTKIQQFIDKYNLSGTIESVKWEVANKQLSSQFVAEDKSLIGKVVLKSFESDDAVFGVNTTSELVKMLNVLDETITIGMSADDKGKLLNIKLSDTNFNMKYVLADPAIIPPAAKPKQLPTFEVEIPINGEFITKFIKSKAAVNSLGFAVKTVGEEVDIIIGYSELNTNRISFKTSCTSTKDIGPILFSAEHLKNILTANKETVGKISISSLGLMKISFDTTDFESEYFIVQFQNV